MGSRAVPSVVLVVVLAGLMGAAACSGGPAGPLVVHAVPSVPVDEPSTITLSGADPDEVVQLTATARDARGHEWRSEVDVKPARDGTVDPARAVASGSYDGAHATGLIWSMTSPGQFGFQLESRSGMTVTYRAEQKGRAAVSVTQTRNLLATGEKVTRLRTRTAGFEGYFYSPRPGTERGSAILVLGGSEGGVSGTALLAAGLAAHGHPALAVAYFGAPGVPKTLTDIPLEYFGTALTWLGRRPGVDPRRMAVMGGSRGSEAALLLGTTYPDLVRDVVAASPSAFVGTAIPDGTQPAWTWHGRPVPHADPQDFGAVTPGEPSALIPVQRIRGRVLLVCGPDDLLWPSCPASQYLASRLGSRAVLAAEPKAGHLVDFTLPNVPIGSGTSPSAIGPQTIGGTVQADALGRLDAWPKLLAFLDAD